MKSRNKLFGSEKARNTLKKCFILLEKLTGVKIRNAVIVLDLGVDGIQNFEWIDDQNNLHLLHYATNILIRKYLWESRMGQVSACWHCKGEGMVPVANNLLDFCEICRGGLGQWVTVNTDNEEIPE